jgi:putative aldouronate transport system substrate-binding protein
MPATTEEFYETLVAFRDRDPNGNGRQDEIPFIGRFGGWKTEPFLPFINAFVYHPYANNNNDYLAATNGKLWMPYATEEYREGLRYLSRLYGEGLISPVVYTLGSDEEVRGLVSYGPGEDNRVGYAGIYCSQAFTEGTPATQDYVVMPPLKGPGGVQYNPMGSLLSGFAQKAFITRDCAYPEAAFRLIDFLSDPEVGKIGGLGEEGYNWERVDGVKEGLTDRWGFPSMYRQLIQAFNNPNNTKNWKVELRSAYQDANGNNPYADVFDFSDTPINRRYALLIEYPKVLGGYDVDEVVPPLIFTAAEMDQIREIRTNLELYRSESQALFITGQLNLDRDWNNYLAQLDRIGLKTFLDVAQKAYDRMLGK